MILFKKISFVFIIILVLIQFIQPAHNQNGQVLDTDISKSVFVPENVQMLLKKSCFNCHSNNTNYPFYIYIQPAGWFLSYHIRNGKEKLNFSDFGSYSKRKQESKLKSIAKQIENDVMPLASYTFIHRDAILAAEDKNLIINWANNARDSLSH
ncbi:MAG: heme-binding domain-containing protein [Saprospiraceae bacterium]|nr:heme-binding domain-containing protein [Saprospiraceae bacterium]MBK8298735.1 heme-binding domain-containing protein [Saprospiraceae bacterium]